MLEGSFYSEHFKYHQSVNVKICSTQTNHLAFVQIMWCHSSSEAGWTTKGELQRRADKNANNKKKQKLKTNRSHGEQRGNTRDTWDEKKSK